MEKRSKEKNSNGLTQADMDLAILINRMENRLGVLENKIDILISRPVEKPREEKNYSKPFQHGGQSNRYDKGRDNSNFRERSFFKTVCADCNKECEVPFKPTGDRPVYCKECFSKRRENTPFKRDRDNGSDNKRDFVQKSNFSKPRRSDSGSDNKREFIQKSSFGKPRRSDSKKFDKKKKKKGPHRV